MRLSWDSLEWSARIEGSRTVLDGGWLARVDTQSGFTARQGVEAAAGIEAAEADEFFAAAAGTGTGLSWGFGRWFGWR